MDEERFDRFTKALATGRSRRSVLRGLGAGIAAGLAGLGASEVSANHGGVHKGGPKPGRCGEAGQPCKFGTHCCSGTCLNGYCACPEGQELVDGACVATDPCADVTCVDDGNECTTSTCVDGQCETQILDGNSCSNGAGTCDSAGVCRPNDPCAGANCDDDNECTTGYCMNGVCYNDPVADGTTCSGGFLGLCASGTCI